MQCPNNRGLEADLPIDHLGSADDWEGVNQAGSGGGSDYGIAARRRRTGAIPATWLPDSRSSLRSYEKRARPFGEN